MAFCIVLLLTYDLLNWAIWVYETMSTDLVMAPPLYVHEAVFIDKGLLGMAFQNIGFSLCVEICHWLAL